MAKMTRMITSGVQEQPYTVTWVTMVQLIFLTRTMLDMITQAEKEIQNFITAIW